MFSPEGLSLIAEIIFSMLRDDPAVDSIGGLELGAVPIVSAVSMRSKSDRPIDGFVVRKDKLAADRDSYVRAMAALIDAARFIRDPKNADKVAEACSDALRDSVALQDGAAQGEVVSPANMNGAGQVVIAGSAAAVARAVTDN